MLPKHYLLLLVGCQAWAAGLAFYGCPSECTCSRASQVECTGARIAVVPTPLPWNAMSLQILNTHITELNESPFLNISALIALRIEKNELAHIAPGAFRSLGSLRYLSLANNKLQSLPEESPTSPSHLLHTFRLCLTLSSGYQREPRPTFEYILPPLPNPNGVSH